MAMAMACQAANGTVTGKLYGEATVPPRQRARPGGPGCQCGPGYAKFSDLNDAFARCLSRLPAWAAGARPTGTRLTGHGVCRAAGPG
jgi:hypothetical protein